MNTSSTEVLPTPPGIARSGPMSAEEKRVIFASSLGTVFEWYDFYLFGVTAAVIGRQFFAPLDEATRMIFTLLAFAAGFAVRPFGAVVFGRLGDMIGRKHTFLVTILIMGGATFVIGLLPTYASLGLAAPGILIALRMLQGLAIGGEYGGAAVYVAEHAPPNRRGAYTAWIQTTATVGLFIALIVVMGTRSFIGEKDFGDWGWRVPYLLSAVLLGVSVWIRMQLAESPTFERMKREGRTSKSPIRDAFGNWGNLRLVLIALFGLTAGQAVVWYTGQFYALFFLEKMLRVDGPTANVLMAVSLLIGTPFFVIFGSLSDRIGRKPIIMLGLALAALTYHPLFEMLTRAANPAMAAAHESAPVVVSADPNQCSVLFNPTGTAKFTSPCDVARTWLTNRGVSYEIRPGTGTATVSVGSQVIESYDAASPKGAEDGARFDWEISEALNQAGYPTKAKASAMNKPLIIGLLTLMVIYVTMVYGPIAAILVEMFPARIRYTSMSLPYHIGNGWFGGFLPAASFAMVTASGNIYQGLWYPIVVAGMSLLVGLIFVKDRLGEDAFAEH